MSVSIIVPSYRGEQRLPALLDALAAQETDREWEVVLVLDGSPDSSATVAAKWQDRIPLRILEREENRGRSATLNEGFRAAEGDVLVRCDDDLVPRSDYVVAFANRIESEPEAGVVGLCRNDFPDTPYARSYGRPADVRFRQEARVCPAGSRWQYWGGNCAVHRAVWESVGPYDESFREYGYEDVDWGYRLHRSGRSVVLAPELETPHRVAATTTASRMGRARLSGRARVHFEELRGISRPGQELSLWNAAVAVTSIAAGPPVGRVIDVCLPVMGPRTALRLVDLAVQASFRRGIREAHHRAV